MFESIPPARVLLRRGLTLALAIAEASLVFPAVSSLVGIPDFYAVLIGAGGVLAIGLLLFGWFGEGRGRRSPHVIACLAISCSLLSSSADAQPPVAYEPAPWLQAALSNASRSIVPCNDAITIMDGGNSNKERLMNAPGGIYELLWNTLYKAVRNPALGIDRNAISMATGTEWGDWLYRGWSYFAPKLAAMKDPHGQPRQPCSAQAAFWLLTQRSPFKPELGELSDENVEDTIAHIVQDYPSIKFIVIASIDRTFCNAPCLMPTASGYLQDAQLARLSNAGLHAGIPMLYLPNWTDNCLPNPSTVSSSFPQGLAVCPSDKDADMVHPNLAQGTPKIALSMVQRMRENAQRWFWFMWKDQAPPDPAI